MSKQRKKRQQRKRRKQAKRQPAQSGSSAGSGASELVWRFGPDVPTMDYFETFDLNDYNDLQETIHYLLRDLRPQGTLICWDAIVCEEQGIPLSPQQQEAASGLISFNEEDLEDRVLYIDEIPRPDKPWYEIVRQYVSHLDAVTESDPGSTSMALQEWPELFECLEEHCEGMSLPKGVELPPGIIAREVRDRLWLRYCTEVLTGIEEGDDEFTLTNEEQHWRIELLARALKEQRRRLKNFQLTPEMLADSAPIPQSEKPVLVQLLIDWFDLPSASTRLEKYLRFQVGHSVSPEHWVTHPNCSISIRDWQGRIYDISKDKGDEALIGFELDSQTLRSLPEDYIRQCEIQGLAWNELCLHENELHWVRPRDTEEEAREVARERRAPYAFIGLGEAGPRIQEVLDGLDPDDIYDQVERWGAFLEKKLSFPFEAEVIEGEERWSFEIGERIQVLRIMDFDNRFGVMVDATDGEEPYPHPLCDLEARPKSSPNYQPVKDYCVWYANR